MVNFLSEKIFGYVSTNDDISVESFNNYLKGKKQEELFSDIDNRKKETNELFYINLDMALNDNEFDIGKLIDYFDVINNSNDLDKNKELIKK